MHSFFANPWMLAAAIAVALPILIEWLFRRRRQQVELPTIRFLLRNREQERVRRQGRILLFLRMVGIFLLVLAVARPLVQHGLLGATRQRHIVLDGTASMGEQVGVTMAFGLAQKKAAAMLRETPKGPCVTVLYLGGRGEAVVESETDLHTAAARVGALRASSGAAPMSDALAWVRDHLGQEDSGEPELYASSDFQKRTWMPQGAGTVPLPDGLASRCETFLVDVGGHPEFNYMLTDFSHEEWLMSTGMPVRFRAAIETWGQPRPGTPATVTFLVDGVKKDVREVRPTGGPASVVFEQPVFVSAQHLLLRHPNGRKERLTPREREGRKDTWVVSFDRTQEQGVYEFVDTVPGVLPRRRFVVNQRPEEGDLSRLGRNEARDAFGGAWQWVGLEVPVEDLAAKLHTVTELAPGLLWMLAVVLGAEAFLAARFGRRRATGKMPVPPGRSGGSP